MGFKPEKRTKFEDLSDRIWGRKYVILLCDPLLMKKIWGILTKQSWELSLSARSKVFEKRSSAEAMKTSKKLEGIQSMASFFQIFLNNVSKYWTIMVFPKSQQFGNRWNLWPTSNFSTLSVQIWNLNFLESLSLSRKMIWRSKWTISKTNIIKNLKRKWLMEIISRNITGSSSRFYKK